MAGLLLAWERRDPEQRGLTAAEVIERLKCPPSPAPDWYADLCEAVGDAGGAARRPRARDAAAVIPAPDLCGSVPRPGRAGAPGGAVGRVPGRAVPARPERPAGGGGWRGRWAGGLSPARR